MRVSRGGGIQALVAAVAALAGCGFVHLGSGPNASHQTPAFPGQTRAAEEKLGVAFDVVTVAEGLLTPWGLAFLPDGRMLVTERPGTLRVVSKEGKVSEAVAGIPTVDAHWQGGLLGVALDPRLVTNRWVYWSSAEANADGTNNTSVARGKFAEGASPRVEEAAVIFRQRPSLDSRLQFGSRLVFDRDGKLFVTVGDRSITEGRMRAQRLDGLLGKVARIEADGKIPADNRLWGGVGRGRRTGTSAIAIFKARRCIRRRGSYLPENTARGAAMN